MSENGEIYTAGKNFTLPLAVTGWTNSTSGRGIIITLIIEEFGKIKQRFETISLTNLGFSH